MQKRTIVFGTYNTAEHGWTMSGLVLSDAEQKTNYVEKSGGDGSWDLSTALTNGIPRYRDRILTVTLEHSKGSRADREALINDMVNELDGLEWPIILPDRPDHYLFGRLHIAVNYSDLAHAMVTVTGNVEPWLYCAREIVVKLNATAQAQTALLRNKGRRTVVPVLTSTGNLVVSFGGVQADLSPGTYEWPTLLLTPGFHELEYSGTGTLTITYREAVLR